MDLKTLLPIIVQGSLVLVIASIGLRSQWRDLGYAFRRPWLLFKGFVAVNLVVPIVAITLVSLLPIEPLVKLGIAIMAVSPLAPFAPGKMMKAGAEGSFVVGMYVALLVIAIAVVPATFVLLHALFPAAGTIDASEIAAFVAKTVLLPLCAGLLVATLVPGAALRLSAIAGAIGNATMLVLFILLLFKTGGAIFALIGNGALFAIVATVICGLAAGHWLGGADPNNRAALALAAATRHPGIAGLIIQRNYDDKRVMLAVVLFLLVSIIVSAIYQAWAKKQAARALEDAPYAAPF